MIDKTTDKKLNPELDDYVNRTRQTAEDMNCFAVTQSELEEFLGPEEFSRFMNETSKLLKTIH